MGMLLFIICCLLFGGWLAIKAVQLLWFLLPGILFMAFLGWLVG